MVVVKGREEIAISSPSPDVEMDVDAPEAGEVAFTLVTNKKRGKGKAKVSSPPEPRLPQSKSFLKVLGVPYWDSKTSLPITPAQVAEALSSSF